MAFASIKAWLSHASPIAAITETLAAIRALALECGGTGVAATGATDADKANNVLQTWSLYDGSNLVLASKLPTMVGAGASTNGTKGAVPQPLDDNTSLNQYDRYAPLRGDATWGGRIDDVSANGQSSVWLTSILSHTGTEIFSFDYAATPDARFGIYATTTGSRYARMITKGSASHVSMRFEAKGAARMEDRGDPLRRTMRSVAGIVRKAFGSTFDAMGVAAPTVLSPGQAAATLSDASANYVQTFNAAAVGSVCGTTETAVVQPRHGIDRIVQFRASMLEARLWLALTTADPSGFTGLICGASGINPPTLTATGVFAVDGSTEQYTRNDGGSFITDGVRVGMLVLVSGFATTANLGVKTVTAVAADKITVSQNLTTELTPGGAVTLAFGIEGIAVWYDVQVAGPIISGTPNITAAASDDSFTRSAGNWITEGFRVGTQFTWTGWSNGANNGTHTITAITATKITCAGSALVDEGPTAVGTVNMSPVATQFFRAITSNGVAVNTTGTFTIASGKIHRATGSFIREGVRVGQLLTTSGFAVNGSYHVTAVTATDITTEETLADETPGGSVTLTCAGYTETISTIPATANTYTRLRMQRLSDTEYEFSVLDAATQVWTQYAQITSNVPLSDTTLGRYNTLYNVTGGSIRNLAIEQDTISP